MVATRRRALKTAETRGVHHLALCTDDMKATIDFYVDVMGMPLVHAMKVPAGLGVGPRNRGNPPYETIRHYFFDMGNDSLLAFFEIPKGKEPPHNRNAIGAMQHCSFVVTPMLFKQLEERLRKCGIPYNGPIPQMPGLDGIYFFDPNGIRLEFACQSADGDKQDVVGCASQARGDAELELATIPGANAQWIRKRLSAFPS